MFKIPDRFRHLNGPAGVGLLLGPGLLGLGVDSWISHFAGKEESHIMQWVPVYFAPIGALIVLAVVLPRLSATTVRLGLRVTGLLSFVVGMAGTLYHLIPFWNDMQDEAWSFAGITGALSIAPPVFAPAAFAAVGGILWLIASPNLVLHLRARPRPQTQPAPGSAPALPVAGRRAA